MKTHETKNWSELAMILTARLRLQYICTGAADKRCAAFLMEIMQRSGEADPAAALSYMVMADSAAGDDVLRYWTALYERGRIWYVLWLLEMSKTQVLQNCETIY